MPVDMTSLLEQTAGVLCAALDTMLPKLTAQWWETCVKGKLSFQQRQHVERRGVTRLDELDLAALLRILDQNWFELADAYAWPYDGRNYVKEMQTVRNRWAHAQVAQPPADDVYRDLDPTVMVDERAWILACVRSHGRQYRNKQTKPPVRRMMGKAEVAERFGKSKRFVDLLAAKGILHKLVLPGNSRVWVLFRGGGAPTHFT